MVIILFCSLPLAVAMQPVLYAILSLTLIFNKLLIQILYIIIFPTTFELLHICKAYVITNLLYIAILDIKVTYVSHSIQCLYDYKTNSVI